MSLRLTIVRGLPGAGKTTCAQRISSKTGAALVSADDFFTGEDGVYRFNPSLLPQAHAACQGAARRLLAGDRDVVVHNTFTQGWEFTPYLRIAQEFDAEVEIIDVFDGGCSDEELFKRNVHEVPLAGIAAMRARWDADLAAAQAAEPRAPWERG
jgi:predicted kinase